MAENEQNSTSISKDEIPVAPRRRWLSFFSLELFFDFLLIIITAIYAGFAYRQWKAIDRQAALMASQLTLMHDQSTSMTSELESMRDQANSMRAQTSMMR